MNITYGIVEEIYSMGITSRTSYGIAAYEDAGEDSIATIVEFIPDIISDKQSLSELVLLCNRLKLSLIHLNDVLV